MTEPYSTAYGTEALERREESMSDPWWWPAAEALSRAALPEIEAQRDYRDGAISGMRASGYYSEDDINEMCEAYHQAEQKQRDAALAALWGEELPDELLSRPVDQDLLGGCEWGVLTGSFDEFAVDEGRSGADQGDEVRRVDRAPAVLG